MGIKGKKVNAGNLLVITHWSYNDALIQTYTLPYLKMIREKLPLHRHIYLVTSEQERIALERDQIDTINMEWEKSNITLIAQSYRKMGIRKILWSCRDIIYLYHLIKKKKIRTIHAFCTPAGGLGYILCKLTGASLVIDSYEPHAESMLENNTWSEHSLGYKILANLEKRQSRYATHFIGTSAGMRQYARERYSVDPQNFFVKPACVDLQQFALLEKDEALAKDLSLENKVVCVYAGKLGGIYLKEELFDFIAECYQFWKDKFIFLMLTNASRDEVAEEMKSRGLPGHIIIQKFIDHKEIPRYLSLADFAINPVKPVKSKKYCTSIKDGEYWAMGLPVVITRDISDDSAIISNYNIGYELKELTTQEYKSAVVAINALLLQDRQTLRKKIRAVAEKYRSYSIAESVYEKIYA